MLFLSTYHWNIIFVLCIVVLCLVVNQQCVLLPKIYLGHFETAFAFSSDSLQYWTRPNHGPDDSGPIHLWAHIVFVHLCPSYDYNVLATVSYCTYLNN